MKIESTQSVGVANGCKILVYGGSGAGKTRLLASAPRPLIISAERGLMSLRKFNLPVVQITKFADLVEVFKYVAGPQGRQYDTLGLDSVSEIAETLYAELKKKYNDPRKLYPDLQDKIATALRDFRDLPGKNVVMLAKEEENVDAMGNKSYRPNFPGKQLANQAPYFVDEVFHLRSWADATGRYYGLQTKPSPTHVAKDRSGNLNELENADPATGGGLTMIFNKMLA